jgi:DNA-binding transcriptional LysR family regulator
MFEDIHALVQFAEAGSVVRAAARLHRTPSAVTRQVQRLEAALGAELLDRTVKPPRLTPLGVRIVEQSRDVLKRVEDLKALAAKDAEPTGLFRIGVSHPLADASLVDPVQALAKRFPKLRLRLVSDLASALISKIRAGELDLAAVLVPEDFMAPPPLLTEIVATDRMVIVESRRRSRVRAPTWQKLSEIPWILNPPGCRFRAALLDAMDKAGAPATVTAEIHNMHLQLAFIEAGHGRGLLPKRFVDRFGASRALRVVEPDGFEPRMAIAIVRTGPLGSLESVAQRFKGLLAATFKL